MFIIVVGRRLLLSIYIHNKILSSNLVLLLRTADSEMTAQPDLPTQHNTVTLLTLL